MLLKALNKAGDLARIAAYSTSVQECDATADAMKNYSRATKQKSYTILRV